MDLSDRKALFPERPEFKKWRHHLTVLYEIRQCVEWDGEKLTKTDAKKLEHLYEFLAAQGRLAEFDAAWKQIEDANK